MKRFIQDQVALLIVPACLLLSAPAFGQSGECSGDEDCAEGQLCQKGTVAGGCTGTSEPGTTEPAVDGPSDGAPPPADDCVSEPQEAETGYCYTPPTACEADSDCGEYLSCVASYDSGGCAVDSEGNTTCADPDPSAVKYCSTASVSCETNDECPRDFECIDVVACPAILCAEGDEKCLDSCTPSGEKYCNPKQIPCEESTDCPSAWSCFGNVTESCSGGGTAPSGGTVDPATDPAPTPGEGTEPAAPDEVTCTTQPALGFCQPDAWSGGVAYANDGILEVGADDDGAPTSAPAADPMAPSAESTNSSSGGGCSVAQGNQPPDFAWVLALLAALPLVRRRQNAA